MLYLWAQSYKKTWTKHILIYRYQIVICEKKITFLQSLLLSGWLASQCISLLRAWSLERYLFGIVRPLPSYIRYKKLRKLKLKQKYKWLLHEWCKNYPIFIVIIVYDCILFFVYFVLLTKSLKDTVTLQFWSFQEAAITIYFFKLQMLNYSSFLYFPQVSLNLLFTVRVN